ncbi:MAG: hypothetical protein JWN95_319 [Frankiales bacterium]|nr:hypothetical protein [Frankiales bacterium]
MSTQSEQVPQESEPTNVKSISRAICSHQPHCPDAAGSDRDAAHVIAFHPEQGWSLLCNGVVLFEDSGEILPDGHCVHARRAELTAAALHRVA